MSETATQFEGPQRELDLAYAGIAGQSRALARREVCSRELVELALARIEATEATLNCFRVVCAESALEQARDAERQSAAGEKAPLLGIPIAIKDDVDLAGHPTAFGCSGDFKPAASDCAMVSQLKAAGAIIVGKTNTPEVGLWPFTEGDAFGVTRNPWSLAHTPGGSSGGAAAAVAAGLVPAAIGSDGAGSVRIPAAWTNLIGLKPQRGRISTMPEPEAFNGLTVIGPLTRSIAYSSLLLDALSAPVRGGLHNPPLPDRSFVEAAARPASSLRVGLALNPPFSGAPTALDPEVGAIVEDFAARVEDLGHRVEVFRAPYGLWPGISLMPRANGGVRDWSRRVPDPARLDPRVRDTARHGLALAPLMPLARLAEDRLRRRFTTVFERFDVLLTPTTATPPLPVGHCASLSSWQTDKAIVGACPYAWPWNVTGWPGLSVPAGFTSDGLPIGTQLLACENDEATLLALGAQLEKAAEGDWAKRPPLGA